MPKGLTSSKPVRRVISKQPLQQMYQISSWMVYMLHNEVLQNYSQSCLMSKEFQKEQHQRWIVSYKPEVGGASSQLWYFP